MLETFYNFIKNLVITIITPPNIINEEIEKSSLFEPLIKK